MTDEDNPFPRLGTPRRLADSDWMRGTTLITRLRMIGRQPEANLVSVVLRAILTVPEGENALLEFTGALAEASRLLEEYHRQQRLLDE